MEQFLKRFPAAGYVIMCGLVAVIAWMAQKGLENNTMAMDRLSVTMDRVNENLNRHEVKLENHEVRIVNIERKK